MGEIIVTGQTCEQIAEKMGMTVRLKSIVNDNALWERVWKYCKNIAKFSHAPIALKDYASGLYSPKGKRPYI